ncbi:sensor histidine kinase [Gordonia zhaorongruii]|uniref:sensor histidine kinase n=1 Tax=Gordonia zhaorongruii TaxID=2597659 RepID=UPI001048B3EA|nr:sensor histidine kinase [Gordonia zhaorongruii]
MNAVLDRGLISRIRNDERMPWRQWRWAFGAVWLIFLGFPIMSVAGLDRSAAVKGLGFALIAAFAIVYFAACVLFMGGPPSSADRRGRRTRWTVTLVLGAIAVALLPVIQVGAFGLTPFLMAMITFVAARRLHAVLIVLLVFAAWAIPEIFGWELDFGVVAIMITVGVTMIAMRALQEREAAKDEAVQRQRELNAELAVVAERESVARDVHDILGHSLTVITVKTELAGKLINLDPDRAKAEIAEVNELTRDALVQIRSTVGRLRTPDLRSGLVSTASALSAAGIEADVPDPGDVHTPHSVLFAWVLREAVTNVVRHSGAQRCEVRVNGRTIRIWDNGTGSPLLVYGNGLRGLSERVTDAGGRLTVDSAATGTAVSVVMPASSDTAVDGGMDR